MTAQAQKERHGQLVALKERLGPALAEAAVNAARSVAATMLRELPDLTLTDLVRLAQAEPGVAAVRLGDLGVGGDRE